MTIDEQIEVMQHFRDGGEVEVSKKGEYSWKHLIIPAWKFDEFNYRKKTNLTWREALKKKLPEEYFQLVCERTEDVRLDGEFTKWTHWASKATSFDWDKTKEGDIFWCEVSEFLEGRLNQLPSIPKQKKTRLMTAEELKGKWIKRGEHSQMVIAIVDDEIETVTEGPKTVKKFHENGWKLEDGSPLIVEVGEDG